MDHDIARRVAGSTFEPQSVLQRIVVIDQHRLPGAYDWQHAVLESETMRGIFAALMHTFPMCEFTAGHDVARSGEGRDPAAVFEPSIPAYVIPVQMRAHHVVHL